MRLTAIFQVEGGNFFPATFMELLVALLALRKFKRRNMHCIFKVGIQNFRNIRGLVRSECGIKDINLNYAKCLSHITCMEKINDAKINFMMPLNLTSSCMLLKFCIYGPYVNAACFNFRLYVKFHSVIRAYISLEKFL